MTFEYVERKQTIVAGLAVRSPRRALGQSRDRALDQAWHSVLNQPLGGPLASAYTDYAEEVGSYYTQLVGYRCEALDEVVSGHIAACLPAGSYAKFSATGVFPAVFEDLWGQIRSVEDSGSLVRTYTGDFECYPNAYRIDLYLSVKSPKSGGQQ